MGNGLVALLAGVVLAGACSTSGGDGGDRSASPSASGPSADCEPARPLDVAPDEPQTFGFDGVERSYLLALPDGYDGTTAAPLVLDFHGYSNTKEGMEAVTGMGAEGSERGYVVVTPDALGEPQEWNMFGDPARTDDFAFVDALVADLGERLCIDTERVYAAGHSNGSAFTGFLACHEPYRFAAVAMVAAFVPTTCPVDEVAPSVVAVHGTADEAVPYDGGSVGGGPIGYPPTLDTYAGYGEAYGCDSSVEQDQPEPGIERRRLSGCDHGSEVVLYTVVGGTHEWPRGPGFFATEAVLDFFDDH
jgi:polyhydroxybutyrate depolymerase